MPVFVLTTRVPKVLGADLGIVVCPILDCEGYNGQLVCKVEEGKVAHNRLRIGDRILQTNGIACVNQSKFMEGICHKYRIHTIDFMVLRYYPSDVAELELEVAKMMEPFIVIEPDATLTAAPIDSGLEKHDLILSIDGAEVKTGDEAREKLHAAAGPLVKVKVGRGKLPKEAEALVPKRKPNCDYFVAWVNPKTQGQKALGLFVKDVNGVVIVCKADGGTVAGDHLMALDRVLSVCATPVKTVPECAAAIGKTAGTFWMLIERCMDIPELVHFNKLMNPALGLKPQWAVPQTAPDIVALQSKLAGEKGKPLAIRIRSISKTDLRSASKETVPKPVEAPTPTASPAATPTPSEEALKEGDKKPGVVFKDGVDTTEIYMDVVPRLIKRK